MTSKGQMQVECRIAYSCQGRYVSPIFVKTFRRKVIDSYLGIVDQSPASLFHAHAKRHVVMDLRPCSAQTCIEANIADRFAPVTHVCTLKHVHFAWLANAQMMIADDFPETRYLAYDRP